MYDYTVEMMKKYQHEEKEECRRDPDYDAVADGLCIVTADGSRKQVDKSVKELFRERYETYVKRKLRENSDSLALFMFQGRYKPIVQMYNPRRGMSYIEDNVRQVIKGLPKLPKGERYVFPALRIIRGEEGTLAFVIPR